MSAMIISSLERLIGMAQKLENFGITNIHFYSAKNGGDLDVATIAFVPFVDFVIVGKDAPHSLSLNQIIKEAQTRHIPVLSEECIETGKDKGSCV